MMLLGGLGVALGFGLLSLLLLAKDKDTIAGWTGKIALGGLGAAGVGGFALLAGWITGG